MRTRDLSILCIMFSTLAHAGFFSDSDMIEGVTSTVTAGTTTTLVYNSSRNQRFTGTSNQGVALPSGIATRIGKPFVIHNLSTGSVTVQNNVGTPLAVLLSGEYAQFLSTSQATAAGTWDIERPSAALGGTASRVAEFDSSGVLVSDSVISVTELQQLDNVSSSLCGINQTCTLTGKTIDADGTGNVISNIENADIKAAAAIAVNKLAALTASKSVVTDGSGFVAASSYGVPTNANTASAVVARDASGDFAGGRFTGNVTGALTGNADTATALAANPADCSANNYATAIAASGALTCAQVSLSAGVTGNLPTGNLTKYYFTGYHQNNCSWTRSAATFATPAIDASCTLTEINSGNMTVTKYNDGTPNNDYPGITFTPVTGVVYHFTVGVAIRGATVDSSTWAKLVTSSGTDIAYMQRQVQRADNVSWVTLSGAWVAPDTTAVNVVIQLAASTTDATIVSFTPGHSIMWSVVGR